jgi:hypothetical protein
MLMVEEGESRMIESSSYSSVGRMAAWSQMTRPQANLAHRLAAGSARVRAAERRFFDKSSLFGGPPVPLIGRDATFCRSACPILAHVCFSSLSSRRRGVI